jgi:hypothetical protein
MATLDQVEKLRETANVTFEEARAALDEAGGDMLDALILLERQGKVSTPSGGGSYDGRPAWESAKDAARNEWRETKARLKSGGKHWKREDKEHVREGFRGVGRFLLRLLELGNTNYLDAVHNGETVLSCPLLVLVILLICFFWVVLPLLVVGLFFGWRYRFRGPELGRDDVNSVIEKAENAADELKNQFTKED